MSYNYTKLIQLINNYASDVEFNENDFVIFCVSEKTTFIDLITELKNKKEFQFTVLSDLFAVDYPSREKRFEICYNLLSLTLNIRINIKVNLGEDEYISSLHNIFSAATWYEREIYDMFGVIFENNPDLRRILTDYGFQGHPLRKDFPLTGFNEVKYNENEGKVKYEPVSLEQDYRNFDFMSPWDGSGNKLPGDEKAK